MNISSYNIKIPMRRFEMEGKLGVPEMPKALVIFSSEHRCNLFNYQNDFIAKTLHKNKIATLSVDLLSIGEKNNPAKADNVDFLADRLLGVTNFIHNLPEFRHLPIAYMGTNLGTAIALKAASIYKCLEAVVSYSGNPNMVKDILPQVTSPVLLIYGSRDTQNFESNYGAYHYIHSAKELLQINGASQKFSEKGTLQTVADLATKWFEKYLSPRPELISA